MRKPTVPQRLTKEQRAHLRQNFTPITLQGVQVQLDHMWRENGTRWFMACGICVAIGRRLGLHPDMTIKPKRNKP